jgi:hypothetical protein
MGIYSDYLNSGVAGNFEELTKERKRQLRRISELRGRDVLVVAADLGKQVPGLTTAIGFEDRLPISDQLSNLHGNQLDLILETPGGLGDVAEEIVRQIRDKYSSLAVIIPGWAKSAGTIMAMAGDEILMGPTSALGPIDAQISWQGKQFSAGALLDGFEKIKEEVERAGSLNRAYIPILQGISPGELQHARNGLDFAIRLVTEWLAKYKFQNWDTHSSSGAPVTDEEKRARAKEIASQLCEHSRWLTHGRSIRMDDLVAMRLKVTDYTQNPDLNDAISRYYALLQLTFATNIYKLYETPDSQIIKAFNPLAGIQPQPQQAEMAVLDVQCSRCGAKLKVQANFDQPKPLAPGNLAFPADNKLRCPSCGLVSDVTGLRRQLEAQVKKRVV